MKVATPLMRHIDKVVLLGWCTYLLFRTANMYLPLGITTNSCSHQTFVCPRNESASFQLLMCIKKIPKQFHVIIEEEHPVVGTSDQCHIPTLPTHATSQVQRVWQGIQRWLLKWRQPWRWTLSLQKPQIWSTCKLGIVRTLMWRITS